MSLLARSAGGCPAAAASVEMCNPQKVLTGQPVWVAAWCRPIGRLVPTCALQGRNKHLTAAVPLPLSQRQQQVMNAPHTCRPLKGSQSGGCSDLPCA